MSGVEPETIDWEQYAEELHRIIKEPKRGIVLDANQEFPSVTSKKTAAFELPSGRFQREFLTLWELFNERPAFDDCMKKFTKKAQQIYAMSPFSVMCACTETSKYIMEYTHGELDVGGVEVELRYLGNYPFLGPENRQHVDVEGKNVLIVTDVVASGTSVRRLAELVEETGGRPIAALCVVLVNDRRDDEPNIAYTDEGLLLIAFGKKNAKLPVHSLTRYPIPRLARDELDEHRVLKIDPVTVYPDKRLKLAEPPKPLFGLQQMLSHFERSGAIDFGYYQADHLRFTTAVRLGRLLDGEEGGAIWEKIRGHFRKASKGLRPHVVTTFSREDIRFKEFVQDQLAKARRKRRFEFIPQRDSLESPKSYFLLPQTINRLKNRPVVLLLSSVHTAERLSHLAALLASHGVRCITVICLINRMGSDTRAFVSRIRRLLRGLNHPPLDKREHVNFRFVAVYDVPDVRSVDIERTHEALARILSGYEEATRVPSFRRWIKRVREYVRPRCVTARSFERGTTRPLPKQFTLEVNGVSATAKTHAGKLLLLCIRVVAARDYEPLIDELEKTSDRETFYALFAMLFADISFLKMTGRFVRVREVLSRRVNELRTARLEKERTSFGATETEATIRLLIEQEFDYLFGLAMLSFLDEQDDYSRLIQDVLNCGGEAPDWRLYPINAIYYYGNERVIWTISMLLHSTRHRLDASVGARRGRDLGRITSDLMSAWDRPFPTTPTNPRLDSDTEIKLRLRVKSNLGHLLTELGAHERTEKHQLIRYLHSQLVTPRQHHSPINNALTDVGVAIESQLANRERASGAGGPDQGRALPVPLDLESQEGQRLKFRLEEAIYTTGVLQDIAEAAAQLFNVTPTSRAALARYIAPGVQDGFAKDIMRLGDLLQHIRTSSFVSPLELSDIAQLRRRVFDDLWGPISPLRNELMRYVVDLRVILQESLQWANSMLKRIGFEDVWARHFENDMAGNEPVEEPRGQAADEKWKVLVDPQLLKEALRNILYNVRHNLRDYQPPDALSHADLVCLERRRERRPCPPPEQGEMEYVVLRVTCKGLTPDEDALSRAREGSTFAQHRLEVGEFGGSLALMPLDGSAGAMVELALISRGKSSPDKDPHKPQENQP